MLTINEAYALMNDPNRTESLAEIVAQLSDADKLIVLEGVDMEALEYDWSFWGRKKQIIPDEPYYNIHLLLAGRGFGKLLSLDTPILKADGTWTTNGELVDGDVILDEEGKPTTVLIAHEPVVPEKAYRLGFSDGTYIDAGGEHLWTVMSYRDRVTVKRSYDLLHGYPHRWFSYSPKTDNELCARTLSTDEIAGSLYNRYDGGSEYSIPLARQLEFTEIDLPVHPYVYGVWLGCEDSHGGTVYVPTEDAEHYVRMFRGYGYDTHSKRLQHTIDRDDVTKISSERLFKEIRGSKLTTAQRCIPLSYMQSSVAQRKSLLSGMADIAGHVTNKGATLTWNVVHDSYVDDLLHIIRTLEHTVRSIARPSRWDSSARVVHRVNWRPKYNPYTLDNKRRMYTTLGRNQVARHHQRMITSADPITPVMMRCITVDSPSALYLAGAGLVPTHNTRAMSEFARKKAMEKPGTRIGILGRSAADVRDTMALGEALALDTEIVTPQGMVTMRDISVGQTVIGGDGKPCKVVEVYDVLHDRPCYEVDISGTKIIADENHKWLTWTYMARRMTYYSESKHQPEVRTTAEVRNSLKFGANNNHGIPTTVISLPEADLPIEPWVLGAWLGDGTAKSGDITSHTDDQSYMRARFETYGYETVVTKTKYVFSVRGLMRKLYMSNLLRNKHIPQEYLRGSYQQRMDLLQGLIDTDGSVGKNGNVEFGNNNVKLIDGVYELASSLGIRARRTKPNKDGQHRVTFATHLPVVGMPRKLERMHEERAEYGWRYVRDVVPVDSVPVRCIRVDSPDNTFLITKAMIRTHNSGILGIPQPESEKPIYRPSEAKIVWPNGSEAKLHSAEVPDAVRGPQYEFGIVDEVAAHTPFTDGAGLTAFQNLRLATRLGEKPTLVVATTPKRVQVLKDLLKDAEDPNNRIRVVNGSTLENRSNLSKVYLDVIMGAYEGTSIASQELDGRMLDEDPEGALWNEDMIKLSELTEEQAKRLPIRVVGVDPTVAENPTDECGIIAFGATASLPLHRRRGVVLEDATMHGSPAQWAREVVRIVKKWNAWGVVIESNQGFELLRMTLHNVDPTVRVALIHSSKSKKTRAEPVSQMYEQGRIKHLREFPLLTDQQTTWEPGLTKKSPDRIDALTFAATAAMIKPPKGLDRKKIRAVRMPSALIP